jgi:hypothetical protein
MHLCIAAIYSAGWGGGFMQINLCGKKIIPRSSADITECSTKKFTSSKNKINFTISLL